jgi:hypothetical protein
MLEIKGLNMKRILIVLFTVLAVFAIASCKNEPAHEHTWDAGTDNGNGKMVYECTGCHEKRTEYKTYSIGDAGPAGGLVFYDCDEDNGTGNADGLKSSECGWRYLETTSADLVSPYYCFGFFRESDDASNQKAGTSTAVGAGKSNTEALVAAMGDEAYSASDGSAKTSDYAAKVCANYSAGGKDDWFLPSKDELDLMYENLQKEGLGGFSSNDYWSSSEYGDNASNAWYQNLSSGVQGNFGRSPNFRVRPVRAF